MSLPKYPFDWDPDARFMFLVTLRNHLNGKGHGVDINLVDDAVEAAVKAYNAEVDPTPVGRQP